MSVGDREMTAELLKNLSKGRALVVVEHDMDFVKKIAHRVTVLHQGRVLAEGPMEGVQGDPRVIEVYLGH
jgi:urea transport system ATP-binding protein